MSDLHDEKKLNPAEQSPESPQATRVMPPVAQETEAPVARRRRSARYHQDEEGAETSRPSPTPEEKTNSRVETRVTPFAAPNENRAVPRPAALERAKQRTADQMRHPVSDADYTQRKPLGESTGTGSAPNAGSARQPMFATQIHNRKMPAPPSPEKPADMEKPRARRVIPLEEKPENEPAQQVPENERRRPRGAIIAVIAVLCVALLVLLLLLVPADSPLGGLRRNLQGMLPGNGESDRPLAQALEFTGTPMEGYAPLTVSFNLTTNIHAKNVRLVDSEGNELTAAATLMMNSNNLCVWVLTMPVDQGYTGQVIAQLNDGEKWFDSDKSLTLSIEPAVVPIQPFVTEAPTPEPTETPEPTATAAPVTEPPATDAPTEEPVEAVQAMAQITLEPEETPEPAQDSDMDELELLDELETLDEPEDNSDNNALLPLTDPDDADDQDALPTPTLAPTPTPTVRPTEAPTATSAVTPSPTPEETQSAEETPEATSEPEQADAETDAAPSAEPAQTVTRVAQAADSASPELIANTTIYNNGGKEIKEYNRELKNIINMPSGDAYARRPFGVITFRGNAFRQNAAYGTVSAPGEMSVAWQHEMGYARGADKKYYYGVGWTGQPAIIQWSTEVRKLSNIVDEKKSVKGLTEVILAGLDGKIYFLDLADGEKTRPVINVGYPMRGTPSIHPYSYPIMAVGQYARKMSNGTGGIGMRVYNMLNQKQMTLIDGLDGSQNRPYYGVGSFETSALMEATSDSLVTIGTNGMLYLATMNTVFDYNKGEISIKPEYATMTSRIAKQKDRNTAVESSLAMFGPYAYYADMEGILRCVDTTTLTTVWAVDTGDSVEAAIALDEDENGQVWLYTANELNLRTKGTSQIRRYNAMTGEEDWTLEVEVAKNKKYDVGVKASPVIGQNALSDLVYFTVSGISKAGAADFGGDEAIPGKLIAIHKATGKMAWSVSLDSYTYSSPVAVYDEDGNGWIIQCASSGEITMVDGLTGEVVNTLKVDGTIEASPAVFGSTLVIGTTGKNTSFIYGISLE